MNKVSWIIIVLVIIVAVAWLYSRPIVVNNIFVFNNDGQHIDSSTNFSIENVSGSGCAIGTGNNLLNQLAHV